MTCGKRCSAPRGRAGVESRSCIAASQCVVRRASSKPCGKIVILLQYGSVRGTCYNFHNSLGCSRYSFTICCAERTKSRNSSSYPDINGIDLLVVLVVLLYGPNESSYWTQII